MNQSIYEHLEIDANLTMNVMETDGAMTLEYVLLQNQRSGPIVQGWLESTTLTIKFVTLDSIAILKFLNVLRQ